MLSAVSCLGLLASVVVAWLWSENRSLALRRYRLVIAGIGLQFVLAILILFALDLLII